jgi:hypothetical protein
VNVRIQGSQNVGKGDATTLDMVKTKTQVDTVQNSERSYMDKDNEDGKKSAAATLMDEEYKL